MKNNKELAVIGIIVALIAIVVVSVRLTQKDNQGEVEKGGMLSGLDIKGDYVYFERMGSSSVETKAMIYTDENDNWNITIRYFNSGKEKVETVQLDEIQKEALSSKIKEKIVQASELQVKQEEKDGGSNDYAIEYISSSEGSSIAPINLEALGYAKNIYNVIP